MNHSLELKAAFSDIEFIAFDFDGVFTNNFVYTSEDGVESVACSRSDGLGLSKLRKLGLPMWVISTERNKVVSKRCEKLEINCIQNCSDKLSELKRLVDECQCDLNKTAFVGNDINDLECLKAVGLPIVVNDAHPDVVPFAKYITANKGGYGAVREVCDLIDKFKKVSQ